MRSWKRPLALALIAAAAVALAAVALVATQGLLHVVVMAVLVAALVGGYLLRRYARARLLYDRHSPADQRSIVPVTRSGNPTPFDGGPSRPSPDPWATAAAGN